MPLDPILGGAIASSVASVIGGGISAGATANMNKKTMRYNQYMYNRQRADALSDWERENAYNHPSAQMDRFKAAGLNPHLIYGQSNTGATVNSTSAQSWNPEPPGKAAGEAVASLGQNLGQYYSMQQQAAATDNLRQQNNILVQDAKLREAQVAGQQIQNMISATRNSRESLDFHQQEKLNPISLQAAEIAVQRTAAELQATTDANIRANEMHPGNLRQQIASIAQTLNQNQLTTAQRANVVQNTKNLQTEGAIKEIERNMRANNINPNDPMWQRYLGEALMTGYKSVKELIQGFFEKKKKTP